MTPDVRLSGVGEAVPSCPGVGLPGTRGFGFYVRGQEGKVGVLVSEGHDQEVACPASPQRHWPELGPMMALVAGETGQCRRRVCVAKASCSSGGEVPLPGTVNISDTHTPSHLATWLSSHMCPVLKGDRPDSYQSLSLDQSTI